MTRFTRFTRPLQLTVCLCSVLAMPLCLAGVVTVSDADGKPLAGVMLTQTMATPRAPDLSDQGYQRPGVAHEADIDISAFTDELGRATLPDRAGATQLRARKPGYRDSLQTIAAGDQTTPAKLSMRVETDLFKLAAARPANAWLGALAIGSVDDRQHFQMQCGFCHQQGNAFTRTERSPEEWKKVIDRMVRYGSRLPTDLQKSLPETLSNGYRQLREHPELVQGDLPWQAALRSTVITEWPIGNAMSQTHDMLIAANKLIYVADNIQDRLYEIDPRTNAVTVYKIPHREGDLPGGLIAGRLKEFPQHDSTSNAHSLAESRRDGHIFITPSAQQRLIEFDPANKTFVLHEINGGFYPHTVRIDAQDRVWFTLALSNQVAKFDRATKQFTLIDLPTRGLREKLTVSLIRVLFKLMSWGLPLANWLPIDRDATGTPLPYGIDITPDGKVWFARLHSREIGKIDPTTNAVTMISTPFPGPRRLRSDADGNLWIGAFGSAQIARYAPASGEFTLFDLPVTPKGSDTPYSLNIDHRRGIVWVTGNQSDSLHGFDIRSGLWRSIPLPRRTTFTRDIEIDADGTLYTSNSNWPAWQIEGSQPTLIRIQQP